MTALALFAVWYLVVGCGHYANRWLPPARVSRGRALFEALFFPALVFVGAVIAIAQALHVAADGGRGGES